ncbi:CAP domain-containing protein [Mycobacterium seoulense]|uniref:CAP domain-containing protein n=1 Tax=Mycobacterium seoulense TaxID=386911 RepID=UPI003CFA66C8
MTKSSSTTTTAAVQRMRRAGCGLAACVLGFASATVAMPIAHADPLDNIRGKVNAMRARSGCPPLAYSGPLEAAAQAWVRGGPPPGANVAGYSGKVNGYESQDDPTDAATNTALNAVSNYVNKCGYTDFGVGMVRLESKQQSAVAILVGQPPPPAPAGPRPGPNNGPVLEPDNPTPPRPTPPAQAPPQQQPTVTVTGDVDVYNIPDGDHGKNLGILRKGSQVQVLDRKNGFAHVKGSAVPTGVGYAWGDFIPNA